MTNAICFPGKQFEVIEEDLMDELDMFLIKAFQTAREKGVFMEAIKRFTKARNW